MPKVIPDKEKRVPLNCLIKPSTRELMNTLRNKLGDSHGEIVDEAVATLVMTNIVKDAAGKYTPEIEAKIKTNITPRAFKGALLKPKDRK